MTRTAAAADPVVDGLQRVLAAQQLAVYGYPALGVRLPADDQVGQARTLEAAHRLARDAVAEQLVGRHATPNPAATGYQPPAPVTDPAAAVRWAVEIEQASAAAYRYLLGCAVRAGDGQRAVRQQALTGLATAAESAAYWRALIAPDRPTTPFPGAP